MEECSVSIIVPCRNEKGNIETTVKNIPSFGTRQELIFVEGHSVDGTYEECSRVIRGNSGKDIKLFRQTGEGKNDAVRLGFDKSSGDILMILDADLTVMPEDLELFYRALRDGKGDFINGSRLVLPMEKGAMPLLNLFGNKLSALFLSWLLGQRFTDVLCGVKVMFRSDYQSIHQSRGYFGYSDPWGDFDLLMGASKLGLKIAEIPVRYKSRTYGAPQIKRWRHSLRLMRMVAIAIWKIKFKKWQ